MRSDQNAVRLDPSLEMLSERLNVSAQACVAATVVTASGSTYRKPGARMLIEADGRITGLLSGGCFEQDLREHAINVLSAGLARTVSYDMRGDNDLIFGIGAGCEGRMGVLLEPAPGGGRVQRALAMACELSQQGESVALAAIHQGRADELGTYLWRASVPTLLDERLDAACLQAIEQVRSQDFSWSGTDGPQAAWLQAVLPLPAILICGAGPDAEPLAAALRALHIPLTIADHRPAYANPANFPGATVLLGAAATLGDRVDLNRFFAAVVMSHHLASDADYLRVLARTQIGYIGVLGPRLRRSRLLAEMGGAAAGFEERLRGPIGLDIGAVTPEAIALAITAEIYAAASGRSGGPFEQVKISNP